MLLQSLVPLATLYCFKLIIDHLTGTELKSEPSARDLIVLIGAALGIACSAIS